MDGLRTPFVKAGKEFKKIHPKFLASTNLKEFLYKRDLRGDEIEEVIFGHAFTLPDSPNMARVMSLYAGLDKKIPASTIHKNCASSMESFMISAHKIQNGHSSSLITGGVESMSYIPLF